MKSEEFLETFLRPDGSKRAELERGTSDQGRATTAQLYADIIDLPHHEPKHHPRMSMWNRAAQFAPFAALAGYDAAIQEVAILNG